jgi:hypothetical protein
MASTIMVLNGGCSAGFLGALGFFTLGAAASDMVLVLSTMGVKRRFIVSESNQQSQKVNLQWRSGANSAYQDEHGILHRLQVLTSEPRTAGTKQKPAN